MKGEELREIRIKKQITQKKLAEMLGYEGKSAECVVQQWEHDRQPIPLAKIRKLSEILGVPIDRFIP